MWVKSLILVYAVWVIVLSSIVYIFSMDCYKQPRDKTCNSQQDECFMQPMLQKLPPNEIISDRYEPDVAAHVKLILNKDQRRNNVNFVPPKNKNMQLFNYANLFNVFDYLGKKYGQKINQIIYFKFNNSKYNVDPTQKHLTRTMPAFYVPFQQLYNTNESFFTRNIGLNFPQTSNTSCFPNIKNNRGCSLDPIFNSNYESSNLFAVLRNNPFQYDLILQNDVNSCEKVNWFNFAVQFSSEGYYSFNIVNMTTDMTKLFENGMKISYCYLNNLQTLNNKKNGQGWSLCGQNIKFTKSRVQRQNKRGETYYNLYFQFKCKNKHDILMFAFETPYTTIQCERYFNNIIFKRIKKMMVLEKIQYGKTISGSCLYSYVLKRKKTRNDSIKPTSSENFQTNIQPQKHRKSINLIPINRQMTGQVLDNRNRSIVVLSRIQGSDINGSFILEGIMDFLLESIEYQTLKKTIDFYFVPMVNVDSVKYGNTASNLTGSILHKNWKSPHKTYQAETFYIKEFLNQINKQTPINLIINLTAEHSDIFTSVISIKNEGEETEDSRVFPYVLSRRNRLFSYEKCYFYNKNENNSMCCVLNETFPKALVYEMNVSHFQMKKTEQNQYESYENYELKQAMPESYRSFGRQLIANYLQHVKLYEKNNLLRQKWIREIQQLQHKLTRTIPCYTDERKVQEKFAEAFYLINNYKEYTSLAEIKSHNNITHKYIDNKAIPEFRRHSKNMKRQKLAVNKPVFKTQCQMTRTNAYEMCPTNDEISQQMKKQTQAQQNIGRPYPIFRISDKKTSILKNCSPTLLHFENEKDTKTCVSLEKNKLKFERQLLKKELSTKLLKKVKIQDTIRTRKDKMTYKKAQFLYKDS